MLEHEAPEPVREPPAPTTEIAAPVVAPGMGVAGATTLARTIGNRAFASVVASGTPPPVVPQAPAVAEQAPPSHQRIDRFLPVVGGYFLYEHGKDKGWWGEKEGSAAESKTPPTTQGGGIAGLGKSVQRAALQMQRDQNLRIRKELNNQVFGQIETAKSLMDRAQPNTDACRGVVEAVLTAVRGFGLSEKQAAAVTALRDAVGEAKNITFAMSTPRGELIQSAKSNLDSTAGSIEAALATPAPAPATAPPAGGAVAGAVAGAAAPTQPVSKDQEAALRSVAQQLRTAGTSLGQGTKQQVDDVILILTEMPHAVESAAGGAPAHMQEKLSTARNQIKGVITWVESLKRNKDENRKAAVEALRKAREAGSALFSSLQEEDKELEKQLAALDAPAPAGGAAANPGAAAASP